MNNVIVQTTNPDEKAFAETLLSKSGPISSSQVYVRGLATDQDVAQLRDKGFLVEQLPAEFSESTNTGLGWLEPQLAAAHSLGLMATAQTTLPPEMQELEDGSPDVCVIQTKGPMRTAWKKELADLNVQMLSAKANFGLKVRLPRENRAALQNLDFVARVVTATAPERQQAMRDDFDKFKQVQQSMVQRDLIPHDQPTEIKTFELKTQTEEQIPVIAGIMAKDARVKNLKVGRIRLRFDCDEDSPLLDELAHMTNVVSWVQPFICPVLDNAYVRETLGIVRNIPPVALPWDGTGEIVGVADSGMDETHPDLKQALIMQTVWVDAAAKEDPFGHGTHVSGTIAGRGIGAKEATGVAPGAKLVMQRIGDDNGRTTGVPVDLNTLFQEAYDAGARIHNNSWGMIAEGRYSADSYEVDQFVYDHPDFLIVVSAGNDGKQQGQPDGSLGYDSLRAPATAKNAITVGASCSIRPDGPHAGQTWVHYAPPFAIPNLSNDPICGNAKGIAAFSSRGPSDDERIKPDVVAPGTDILSTRSAGSSIGPVWAKNDKYMFLWGTSMAAPAVAGAAAVLRQYYREVLKHEPSAALLKATLINSAKWSDYWAGQDTTVGEPNFHQGFGRVDLTAIIPSPKDKSGLKVLFKDVARTDPEAINKGDQLRGKWEAGIAVEPGLPLVVTMAWTDRAAHGLQQDLDLQIRGPDGKLIVGNAHLNKPPWAMGDRKNNVEQIRIDDPPAGSYRVLVFAYNTPFEDQGFSVVATGKITSDWLP